MKSPRMISKENVKMLTITFRIIRIVCKYNETYEKVLITSLSQSNRFVSLRHHCCIHFPIASLQFLTNALINLWKSIL